MWVAHEAPVRQVCLELMAVFDPQVSPVGTSQLLESVGMPVTGWEAGVQVRSDRLGALGQVRRQLHQHHTLSEYVEDIRTVA